MPAAMDASFDWKAIGDEAVSHLVSLLRIDTANPPGNERPAADYVAKVLEREHITYTLVESDPGRANVVARLPGSGKKAPILLNGHLDVVPADRDKWTHDPFGGVESGGYVWGRGAIDMKNMVTMSLMTLVLLKRAGITLDRDVIFAAVADEEAGSTKGSLYLVEQHPELVRAEYVLNEVGGHTLHIGSGRFYPVQVAEKGICWFELVAEGQPGHGSMPHAENAVVKLAHAIAALGDTRLPMHLTPVVRNFLQTIATGAPFPQNKLMPLVMEPRLAGFLLDLIGKKNPGQANGINAMLRNTVSPTILSAGRRVNVIPAEARAELDGRLIPGQSIEAFVAEVQAVVGRELRVNVLHQHEGVTFPSDTPLYEAIRRATERHDPGAVVVPYMIPGFTDSFAYARLGATCYGFSPTKLGPELEFTRMFHGHDERIPRDGFTWGVRVLYELVRDFCRA
jgi:acetylornithine deacetylase/succinyl-diaminopimelate desuccinylase-like protein